MRKPWMRRKFKFLCVLGFHDWRYYQFDRNQEICVRCGEMR